LDATRHQKQDKITYSEIKDQLKDCIFFNRFSPGRCFRVEELLPSTLDGEEGIQHQFVDEKDLQSYVLRTVFGRKRQLPDDTSLQDWLYHHPNKLASIREIRESI